MEKERFRTAKTTSQIHKRVSNDTILEIIMTVFLFLAMALIFVKIEYF